jgi:uncharacterized protein (TIGR02757 family)
MNERDAAIKGVLDAIWARCDIAARREADPVGLVHRFASAEDRELVALVAACAAFGNAKAIHSKLEDLLSRLGPSPRTVAERPELLRLRLRGWKHRVFRGEDVARLLAGARKIQRADGLLGERFRLELVRASADATGGDEYDVLRSALAAWCQAIRTAGGLRASPTRRGPSHLLPDPSGASGCKRLLLFLRWMVRPADGVDLGLWPIDPSRLLVPVDVHIHKLSRNLGLTRRPSPSWRTTVEITRALAKLDPADPTKYDFSLCHMGMLQRCPSRRDAHRCEGCGVKPLCVHWRG